MHRTDRQMRRASHRGHLDPLFRGPIELNAAPTCCDSCSEVHPRNTEDDMNTNVYRNEAGRATTQAGTSRSEMTLHNANTLRKMVSGLFAAAVALGLLSGVAALFQQQGKPLAQLAAAEVACSS